MHSCSESFRVGHGHAASRMLRAFLLIFAVFLLAGMSSLAWGQAFTLSTGERFVSFADTEIGGYGSAIIQINTDGSRAISAVSASGDFNITDTADCPMPVSTGSCTITVKFHPSAPGRRWAPLVVTDEGNSKHSFGLVGRGIGPGLAFVPGVISTVVGNGTRGFEGDGGEATSALLNGSWGLVFDQSGSYFVADIDNNRVRKVDASGTITTFAGDGTGFFGGDGGPAGSAQLNHPSALALDSAGNLYIADTFNGSVRKVDLNGTISTVAGTGQGGTGGGDGQSATDVQLGAIYGIAVDDSGNLFIADNSNSAIRKVATSGTISTIAGDGVATFGGDDGPAANARVNFPSCLMVDHAGAIYICDTANYRVRKIDAVGTITTVAGNGTDSYSGDEGPAASAALSSTYALALDPGGDLYIADTDNSLIRVVDGSGKIHTLVGTTPGFSGDGGSALAAKIHGPAGLAVDSLGNLFISGSSVVRKVVVTDPPSLEFGTLNIGDNRTKSVGIVNPGCADLTFSEISLAEGDFSLATNCSLTTPLASGGVCGLQVTFTPSVQGDISESLDLVDNVAVETRHIALHGIGEAVVLPPSPATQLVFSPSIPGSVPNGGNLGTVTVKAEDVDANVDTNFGDAIQFVVTDPNSHVVYTDSQTASEGVATFDLGSTAYTTAGQYGVTATSGELSAAIASFTVAAAGPPIVPGVGMTGNSRLFSPTNVGESSSRNVALRITGPITIGSVTADGDFTIAAVVVNTQKTGAIVEGCPIGVALNDGDSCTLRVTFTPTAPGRRWHPLVVTDSDGKKYSFGLAGIGTGVAVGFPPGRASAIAGDSEQSPLGGPASMALDPDGNLYVADHEDSVVRKIDSNGVLTIVAGGGNTDADNIPATDAALQGPTAVGLDAAGNLYISDWHASAIRKVDVNGMISTLDSAEVDGPTALRLDSAGNLYIADDNYNQVFKLDTAGAFSVVAGTTSGYEGDGGPATAAQLASPEGLTLDDAGNLYIADTDNHVIRKVDAEGTITTIAGASDGTAGYDGDGGPATGAHLHAPMGLDLDAAGNLYITDTDNRVIRKVDPRGIIMTVAGFMGGEIQDSVRTRIAAGKTRTSQWSKARFSPEAPAQKPDSVSGVQTPLDPVTSVNLYSPVHAVVDASGNLFISDYDNALVYKADLATAPTLDFGSVRLGETSEPQTAWTENFGNADLAISQISVSDHFQSGTGNGGCTTESPLAPGALCTLPLAFAPTEAGAINGSAVLTDNAVGSPQTLTLTGLGAANPAAEITFDSAFGSIPAGGNLGTVGVTLRDSHGYVASDTAATLAVTIAGPEGFPAYHGTADASAGVASFDLSSVTLTVAGSYTITVSSEGLSSATAGFTVAAAPIIATKVVFTTTMPTLVDNGGNLGVVRAELRDSSDNLAVASTASVSVRITGPESFTPYNRTVDAVAGVASFDLSALPLNIRGSYAVTVSSEGLTSVTAGFTVSAAPLVATKVVFTTTMPTLVDNGGNLGLVRGELRDSSDNLAVASTASVSLQITGPEGFTPYNRTVDAVAGVASFDLSALPLNIPGSYTITVSSTGLTAGHATFAVDEAADFDLTTESETLTVVSGNPVRLNLTLAPAGRFTGDIALTCGSLPVHARCSFSAASVHADGSNSALRSVLTIHTDGSFAALRMAHGSTLVACWTGIGLFGLLLVPARRQGERRRWLLVAFVVLLTGLLLALPGCGSGSGSNPSSPSQNTPPGTYQVTINATATSATHSTVVTLRVN